MRIAPVLLLLGVVACGGGAKKELDPVVRTNDEPDVLADYGDSPDRPRPVKSHVLKVRTTPVGTIPLGVTASDLELCVAELNRYRASVGAAPLRRTARLEACALEGAKEDHAAGEAHRHFQRTEGCGAMALGENAVIRWTLAQGGGKVAGVIKAALATMWNERGVQRQTMAGRHDEVGCGVELKDQAISVVIDFR